MSRVVARDCAFKMVYQHLFSASSKPEILFDEIDFAKEDKEFSFDIYNNVVNNFNVIQSKIANNLKKNLKIEDLYKLDLAILMCAIAEIDFLGESKGLVINEAVNQAKKYSTDNSPKFINGFLSSIYNN